MSVCANDDESVIWKFNKMSFSDDNFITKEILFTSSMWSGVFGEASTPSSFTNNVTDGSYPNDSYAYNDTFNVQTREYIFDRKDVRYVFVTLYSLVFCFCFFGEWIFLTQHGRWRFFSITQSFSLKITCEIPQFNSYPKLTSFRSSKTFLFIICKLMFFFLFS